MAELFLSESMIARSFWAELRSTSRAPDAVSDTYTIFEHADKIAKSFPNPTGSISRASCELIWLLARYFEPKHIAEVGTFIGRSTLALQRGAKETLQSLATCDFTYDMWQAPDAEAKAKIRYFGKTPSQRMFQQLISEGQKIDLFLIDGRIGNDDIDLISQLKTNSSVFIVDDFEGTEKGVVNAVVLRERFKDLFLIAPEFDFREGWNDSHCLAVLVPTSIIRLTRQQRLPLGLM
jgi:predicted O-methyltransferase YrrM